MYKGGFKNGKMHGKGVYTWKDGKQYKGDFKKVSFLGPKNQKLTFCRTVLMVKGK